MFKNVMFCTIRNYTITMSFDINCLNKSNFAIQLLQKHCFKVNVMTKHIMNVLIHVTTYGSKITSVSSLLMHAQIQNILETYMNNLLSPLFVGITGIKNVIFHKDKFSRLYLKISTFVHSLGIRSMR